VWAEFVAATAYAFETTRLACPPPMIQERPSPGYHRAFMILTINTVPPGAEDPIGH